MSSTDVNPALNEDDRTETAVWVGALVFVFLLVTGLLGTAKGLFGGSEVSWQPLLGDVLAAVKPPAGAAQPAAIRLEGVVKLESTKTDLAALVGDVFAGTKVVDQVKTKDDLKEGRAQVRIAFLDRFGDVRRLLIVWREGKISVGGVTYVNDAGSLAEALRAAHNKLTPNVRGLFEVREVSRPSVDPRELTQELARLLEANPIEFASAGPAKAPVLSPNLTPKGQAAVEALVPKLTGVKGVDVEVAAFVDSEGDDTQNLQLTQKRAEAVVNLLVGKGVDGTRLKARGFGELRPKAANDTPENRAKNRRVELVAREQE